MAYTVLARRYRSGTFDEVIGQEHVAQTLKKAIDADRIAHAYLFNGTRGVGKTSMARILAKALNCQSADKPTTEPCGTCDSCTRIARGDDIDVIEIDAASNTGVDNVRDIIENSQYRPARSRFKVYIIDEVHMLSKSAFNALLKTLEEPPSHVKFILATTEPEKVLPTILSRCQRYDFRNIPTREIAGHLREVCKKENVKADDDALLLVAKAGAGSMRDSLSLLDRLLSVGERQLSSDMIEQMLGLPKSQLVFDLAAAVGDGDVKATLTRANAMVQSGLSVDGLIAALTDHLRNLLVLRTCGPDSELVEVPGLALDELAAQAERFDPVALTQDVVLLEELRRHVRQSQAGRALLDATLARMAMADQFASIGELLGRTDGAPAGGGPPARPRPAAAQPARPAPPAPAGPVPPAQKKKADEVTVRGQRVEVRGQEQSGPSLADAWAAVTGEGEAPAEPQSAPISLSDIDLGGGDDLPAPGKVWEGPRESLGALLKKHSAGGSGPAPSGNGDGPDGPNANGSNVEAVDSADLPAVWQALLALVAAKGPLLLSLVTKGRFIGVEDGRAVIRFGPEDQFTVNQLERNGTKKEAIREALAQVLKQSIGLRLEVAEVTDESPAAGTNGTPPPAAANGHPAGGPPPRRLPSAPAALPPDAPAAPGVRITPELVQSLREAEPLVRQVMDQLGGQVIKVE